MRGDGLRVHVIPIHSFVPSFIHSFVRSFIHSFVRSFIRSFVRSFTRSFIRSFVRSFICSVVQSFGCSAVRSFAHSFTRRQNGYVQRHSLVPHTPARNASQPCKNDFRRICPVIYPAMDMPSRSRCGRADRKTGCVSATLYEAA